MDVALDIDTTLLGPLIIMLTEGPHKDSKTNVYDFLCGYFG